MILVPDMLDQCYSRTHASAAVEAVVHGHYYKHLTPAIMLRVDKYGCAVIQTRDVKSLGGITVIALGSIALRRCKLGLTKFD